MAIEIFTTGYPKSGNTWLGRLLSDLLDSPMQTPAPNAEIERRFCQTGTGGYIIRKTHWTRSEWNDNGKMVFIQRDPRDVAVSAMFYLSLEPTDHNLMQVLQGMAIGGVDKKYLIYHQPGWYNAFVESWLGCRSKNLICTRYEWLHSKPVTELVYIFRMLTNIHPDPVRIQQCVNRQRFDCWKPQFTHSMRKGIVGDWKNYFKPEHLAFSNEFLGERV